MRTWLCVFLFTGSIGLSFAADTVEPLPQAHAHNDYEHERPLLDALDNGFCSVEADVWLVDGELLVAHDRDKVKKGRTLQSLYLDPLNERVTKNNGRVYRDGPQVTLLIDFKSPANPTYQALKRVLKSYENMLTRFENGVIHNGAIVVIISGNRPFDQMRGESFRFAGIDGRLSDLKNLPPKDFMPLISDNWKNHFKWRGDGAIADNELKKLRETIKQVQAEGRRIRFWGSPDVPESWKIQRELGADLINTDNLNGLSKYLSTE